jgi:hypothetical protein
MNEATLTLGVRSLDTFFEGNKLPRSKLSR